MTDPVSALQLADILTPGGIVAAAALVTGIITLLKNLPQFGPWLDAGNEHLVALLLSGVLVVLAVADAGSWRGLAALFQAFVCWYGIATLTVGMHAAGTGVQKALDGGAAS